MSIKLRANATLLLAMQVLAWVDPPSSTSAGVEAALSIKLRANTTLVLVIRALAWVDPAAIEVPARPRTSVGGIRLKQISRDLFSPCVIVTQLYAYHFLYLHFNMATGYHLLFSRFVPLL